MLKNPNISLSAKMVGKVYVRLAEMEMYLGRLHQYCG